MKLPFSLLLAMALSQTPAHAGWEVGGGDAVALKYTKTAHLAFEEISIHKNCALHDALNIAEFGKAVNDVEVVTWNHDKALQGTQINVDRRVWPELSRNGKIQDVIHSFSLKTSKPWNGKITNEIYASCFTSLNWVKIYDRNSGEDTNPTADISGDVAITAQDLVQELKKPDSQDLVQAFDFCRMLKFVSMTHFRGSLKMDPEVKPDLSTCHGADGKAVTVEVAPIAVHFHGNQLKDGINLKSDPASDLIINRASWMQLSRGQRMELLFHEYLGLIGASDTRYQISSRLFYHVPQKFYDSIALNQ